MDDDSHNLQPWVTATTISVTVLAFMSVLLRLWARFERKQKLWWDDWMILWSMVSMAAMNLLKDARAEY